MPTKTANPSRQTEMTELGKVHPGEAVALFDVVLTDEPDDRGRMGLGVQPIALEPAPCTPPPSLLDVDAARNAPAEPEQAAPAEAGQPDPASAPAELETDIQIEHTPEGGTLLFGSVKGDGSWQAMKDAGYHWKTARRNSGLPEGTLYIHMSRDKPAKLRQIHGSEKALREAGFTVSVTIDNQPRDAAEAYEDRLDRLAERADRLENAAERHLATADAHAARHDQLSERFAGGQPIIVGHHSEKSARRDRDKMDAAQRAELAELDKAERKASYAAGLRSQLQREHEHPAKIQRRIDKLESDLRIARRDLEGWTQRFLKADGKTVYMIDEHPPASGRRRESLLAKIPYLVGELEFQRLRLAAAKESGKFAQVDPADMKPGQMVAGRWGWQPLVRVNKKTVTVRSDYGWTDTVQLEEIKRVREATPEEAEHWAKVEADHKARVAKSKAERKKRDAEWAAETAAREAKRAG